LDRTTQHPSQVRVFPRSNRLPLMKENLLSFKVATGVVCAGIGLALASPAHAAPSRARWLALPGMDARSPSGEAVLTGTLVEPDGLTAINSLDEKWDAVTGTGTLNEAAVTPGGQVASREANIVRNADGTFTTRGTMTDFDGHTVNYTETLQRARAGFVAHGTTIGPAGETATYETTLAFVGRNALRLTTVTTKADGTTSTRIETFTSRGA